jgi:hypothetical protein
MRYTPQPHSNEVDGVRNSIASPYDEQGLRLSGVYHAMIDAATAPDLNGDRAEIVGQHIAELDGDKRYIVVGRLKLDRMIDVYWDVRNQVDNIVSGQQG